MIETLHFIRPWWFWALLPYGALVAWFVLRRRASGQWTRYVEPQLRPHVLTGFERQARWQPAVLLGTAGLLAITALAGPAWEKRPQPVFQGRSALVIAFDLSRSMLSQDLKPSRLERARLKLTDILQRRREGQTALVVYAGEAYVVTPLTSDTDTIAAHVPDLGPGLMPSQGSRADRALGKAMALMQQAGARHGHVLLITDHIDADRLAGAHARLLEAGHRMSILAVGTEAGAPIPAPGGGFVKNDRGGIVVPKLNLAGMRQLAPTRTLTVDDSDLEYLLPSANPQLFDGQQKRADLETDTWREAGPWLLLLLLPLAALGFRRGLWLLAVAVLIPLPSPAQALDWQSLWLNDNQQAQQAFESKEYAKAEKRFEDPEWRAAAAYRNGHYEKALKALEGLDTPRANYNRGNALARLGRLPEAIESYDRVLEQNPGHDDARHNRDFLKEKLQQQKQRQQSRQSQQNQNNRQQQSSKPQQSQSADNNRQSSSAQSQSQPGNHKPQGQRQSSPQNGEQNKNRKDKQNTPAEQHRARKSEDKQESTDEARQHAARPSDERTSDQAEQQMQQWLRRVPDDPGGLLRRKFRYQYQQRQNSDREEEQSW